MKYGRWIWCEGGDLPNAYADFAASFRSDGESRLLLEICADNQYEAYLNGCLVAFGQYPDYPWHKTYDAIDISEWAVRGENRLCIRAYCDGTASSVYMPGKAALRFAVLGGARANEGIGEAAGGTDAEREGANGAEEVDVIVGSCGVDGASGIGASREARSLGEAGACDAAHVLCQSGRHVLSRRSPDYISGPVDKVTGQLSYSFACDLRHRDGWLTGALEGFGPSIEVPQALPMAPRPVAMLTEQAGVAGRIVAYGAFQLADEAEPSPAARMQAAWLSPSGVTATPDDTASLRPHPLDGTHGVSFAAARAGIYVVVDLQREWAGFLEVDIELAGEARVEVGYGEHLDDLRVRTSVGGRCYAAHLLCAHGRNRFVHRMKRIAGRYLQLFVYADAFALRQLTIRPVAYPLPDGGAFRCGDHLHERIYDVAVHTLRQCLHTHFEDCPMREQALYGMDARNQMLCGYYAFGETRTARASLRLLTIDQRPDGLLPLCAPSQLAFTIPSFSLFWIMALQEYVQFSGDRAFGVEMLPVAERLLEAFAARRDASGLLGRFVETPYWNFYEWQPGLDGEVIRRDHVLSERLEAPLSALWALALGRMCDLCGALGVDAQRYRGMYEDVRGAFHGAFWDDELGMYRSFVQEQAHYSVYTNALAVCAGLCPGEKRPGLLARIARPAPGVVPATLSCAFFTYEALMAEPAWRPFVFEDIARTYGDMLYAGATTFWETQKGAWDFDLGASLCHAWSSIPVYFYHAYVLGLQPDGDGGFAVRPTDTGIAWAEGGATRRGQRVDVRVETTEGGVVVRSTRRSAVQ